MYIGKIKDFDVLLMNRELNKYKYNKMEYVTKHDNVYLQEIKFNYGF